MNARQSLNVLAVLALLAVNALANALPLNGQSTGEISDRFQVYFVPAGYVFSIWGVIYAGLIAFAVYQALPSQRDNFRLQDITPWFLLSSAANVVWLFLWHYNVFLLTVPVMLALLVSLIIIYLRLGIGRSGASAAETWLVRLPFSIYLGWITVATAANLSAVLWWLGWNGQPLAPEVWAVLVILAAGVLSWLMSLTRNDVAYALVIAWALAGIAFKQASVPAVSLAAWAVAFLVLLVMTFGVVRSGRLYGTSAAAS